MKLSLFSHSLSQENHYMKFNLIMFFSTHKSLAKLLNASGYVTMIVTGTFILITAACISNFYIMLFDLLSSSVICIQELYAILIKGSKRKKMQSLQQILMYDRLVKEPDFTSANFKSTLSSYIRTIFRKCFFNLVLPRTQSSTELGLRMIQKCAFEN